MRDSSANNKEYLTTKCCNWPIRIKYSRGPCKNNCQKTPYPRQLLQMCHKQCTGKQHYCLAWKLWQEGLAEHGKMHPVGSFHYDWGPPPCHWRHLHCVRKKEDHCHQEKPHSSFTQHVHSTTLRVEGKDCSEHHKDHSLPMWAVQGSLWFFMHTYMTYPHTDLSALYRPINCTSHHIYCTRLI